ncbi:MAG: sugar transferase [Gemmobacter sp.]
MAMRDFPESSFPKHGGFELAHQPTRGWFYRNHGKRAIDLALVLLSAPFVLPLIAILALLAATDGHRPFYRQARIGRNGRVFHILKLRTMVARADELLEQHLAADPAARREWDETQKLKHDPRVTRVGQILRASSLDELPQLWNVLRGDMALIGPRPMMPCQQALYPGTAYYRLRPGISGLWQVSERNESSFAERARFDTEYDRTLSLRADLAILWRTAGVVLRCTGY